MFARGRGPGLEHAGADICSQDFWEFLVKKAVQPPLLISLSSVQAEGRKGAGKRKKKNGENGEKNGPEYNAHCHVTVADLLD